MSIAVEQVAVIQAPLHEGIKGLSEANWRPITFMELHGLEQGAWIQYTRQVYVSPAEFAKMTDEAKAAHSAKPRRKKVMCAFVGPHDEKAGTFNVRSIPRNFKDPSRTNEQKEMQWTVCETMRGEPQFYIRKRVKKPSSFEDTINTYGTPTPFSSPKKKQKKRVTPITVELWLCSTCGAEIEPSIPGYYPVRGEKTECFICNPNIPKFWFPIKIDSPLKA